MNLTYDIDLAIDTSSNFNKNHYSKNYVIRK
jgi:hypothetical protein